MAFSPALYYTAKVENRNFHFAVIYEASNYPFLFRLKKEPLRKCSKRENFCKNTTPAMSITAEHN